MLYVIQVTPACNVLCMYLTHVSITSISSYIVNTLFHSTCFILYYTNTYLCRAIARALMFFVVFYIGYTTRNKIVMLFYVMLCYSTCFILYCTNTYLCRAIARALMFFVVFYIGYMTRNKIVCYFMLCFAVQHVLYYIVQILIYVVQ